MARRKKSPEKANSNGNGAQLGFEAKRWVYDVLPAGNANFAWVQQMVHPARVVGPAVRGLRIDLEPPEHGPSHSQ